MKTIIVSLLLLATITGYSQNHFIYLENKSVVHIDSVILKINDYNLKFIDIPPGKLLKTNVSDNSVHYKHDIIMLPRIYIKDSPIIDGQYFYDDLGSFSDAYKITIDKDLKVKWQILLHSDLKK